MAADRGDTAGQGVERVSGVRLSEAEQETLTEAVQNGDGAEWVERLLATRLAPVEAQVARLLCERHQSASSTRQPCAACSQDVAVAFGGDCE